MAAADSMKTMLQGGDSWLKPTGCCYVSDFLDIFGFSAKLNWDFFPCRAQLCRKLLPHRNILEQPQELRTAACTKYKQWSMGFNKRARNNKQQDEKGDVARFVYCPWRFAGPELLAPLCNYEYQLPRVIAPNYVQTIYKYIQEVLRYRRYIATRRIYYCRLASINSLKSSILKVFVKLDHRRGDLPLSLSHRLQKMLHFYFRWNI